jgi:hypothetical protein
VKTKTKTKAAVEPEKAEVGKVHAPASTGRKQDTLWKPGQSGNPLGRPVGSRNVLVEGYIGDLRELWKTEGPSILERVKINNPEKILEQIGKLAPRDVAVTMEQRNSLGVDPALWAGFKRVLAAIEECAPDGMQPIEVFETLERLVRSEFAKPIGPDKQ